jgi:hypothetical protein
VLAAIVLVNSSVEPLDDLAERLAGDPDVLQSWSLIGRFHLDEFVDVLADARLIVFVLLFVLGEFAVETLVFRSKSFVLCFEPFDTRL